MATIISWLIIAFKSVIYAIASIGLFMIWVEYRQK